MLYHYVLVYHCVLLLCITVSPCRSIETRPLLLRIPTTISSLRPALHCSALCLRFDHDCTNDKKPARWALDAVRSMRTRQPFRRQRYVPYPVTVSWCAAPGRTVGRNGFRSGVPTPTTSVRMISSVNDHIGDAAIASVYPAITWATHWRTYVCASWCVVPSLSARPVAAAVRRSGPRTPFDVICDYRSFRAPDPSEHERASLTVGPPNV